MLYKLKQFIKGLIWEKYLPCYVLNRNPMIVFAYDRDFTSRKSEFLREFAGHSSIHLFLMLGWQHETAKMAEPFAKELTEAMQELSALSITVLANSPEEVESLTRLGIRTILCQQNAFIDERKYPIIKKEKIYDAIYIARITPFKRHYLAEKVSSLRLIGDFYESERPYVDKTLADLKHAAYTRQVKSSRIPDEISKAKCGLCLSCEEGAMFVSAEYLLCGIPIVETANLGGRNTIYPPFAYKEVPDTPEAVAEAVGEYAKSRPEPQAIRQAVIENMQKYREILRSELNEILKEHGKPPFQGRFPHKLGLRITRMPWVSWKYGLKARSKKASA